VQNILIEHSVLSTSISNIVRAGWPRKTYNSRNFTLRDSDILHGGIGACGQTFGLLGFWGANGAKVATSTTLLKIYFWITGIRWRKWIRNIQGCWVHLS